MKGRYITTIVLMACRSKRKRNIYAQLEETIAQRKKIMQQWERMDTGTTVSQKDIHLALEETIADLRKVRISTAALLYDQPHKTVALDDKKAA